MTTDNLKRKLAAILSADVKGYSRLKKNQHLQKFFEIQNVK